MNRQGNPNPTPVTAITSSLSKRPTPTLSPAFQVYEPLVKSVLARRLVRRVFTASAVTSWVLASLWTAWMKGGIEVIGPLVWIVNWFSLSSLLFASLWWLSASVPVAVLRKVYISAARSTTLSPSQTFAHNRSQTRYQRALLLLLASSSLIVFIHSFFSYFVETPARGDAKLGIWAGSKRHPYHINGRFIFLFVSHLSGAIFFWTRDVLRDRLDVRWSRHLDFAWHVLPSFASSIASVLLLSVASTTAAMTTFAIGRSVVLPVIYRLPVVHGLLRPFVAHFLRPRFTVSFLWTQSDLIVRSYLITSSTLLIWDITSTMFDVCSSLPVLVTHGTAEPASILVSSIHSESLYFQLHAFNELCSLSSDSDQARSKRALVYSDTKHNPTIWASLVRRCLILLGQDYQLFLRRGQPVATPAAPPAAPAKKPEEKPTTPIIRQQIFKPEKSSPIRQLVDTLASDGAITNAITSASTGDGVGLSEVIKATSNIYQKPLAVLDKDVQNAKTSLVESPRKVVPKMPSYVSLHIVQLGKWWKRERKDRRAIKALPNRELDAMIVEVLGTLVAHSFKEDIYGTVQRDVPQVLEAMVLYLTALEDYQKELADSLPPLPSENNDLHLPTAELAERLLVHAESAQAGEWVEGLTKVLRTSIGLVLNTFDESLASFKFSPKVAAKLQSFVDYR